MRTVIPVENGDTLAAVRGLLERLLTTGIVDAILVPMETPAGSITPALVADPAALAMANPLAPVMGLNVARAAGQVSVREPRGQVAVVLRSCELRALVELAKLKQASLDGLVTIGIDCLGTYDVPVYSRLRDAGGPDLEALLRSALNGELLPQDGNVFRDACQMCEKPAVVGADISLELLGADLSTGIPVALGEDIAERLDLESSPDGAAGDGRRAEVIEQLVVSRLRERDARFAEIHERLEQEGIDGVFATCVRCHNCTTVCPMCYCKVCLFRSRVFDHEPIQYLNWAQRKGAHRMLGDTMLFHLTRLHHMALSCVGCGMCTSGCPSELPVGLVFRAVADQLHEVFEYEPGRDPEEPLPMVTFREDEWMDVGEEKGGPTG
jgi:formate dehydrogenase subunit beta